MDVAQIRLECVKLAHRPDIHPDAVVVRAKVYEAYIRENVEIAEKRKPGRPARQSGADR